METDAIDTTKGGVTHKKVKGKDSIFDRAEGKPNNFEAGVYFYSLFAKDDKLVIRSGVAQEDHVGGTVTNDTFRSPFAEGAENISTNRSTSEPMYTLPAGLTSELN